jgi:hypothetical protein
MKVCIAGNCQAQHMEMMLHFANPEIEIGKLAPVFLMQNSDRDAVYAKFSEADVIFTQRISNEYNLDWISSSELRREFGDKVSVWPNIYFDGYFGLAEHLFRWLLSGRAIHLPCEVGKIAQPSWRISFRPDIRSARRRQDNPGGGGGLRG